jgi:ribosomal protein S1
MNESWQEIINQFPKNTVIKAKVQEHKHYGLLLDIESDPFIGFVPITEIRESAITMDEFPKVNSYVKVLIMDYSLDDRMQVWMSIKKAI